ncbi:MAG: SHOCT domain-containing protein [Sphaerochaeta sp.]|nr:SHOCT domain-containing protein [Sphaerochaeta sp.]
MHGYTWLYRGMQRTGGFACLNYMDSPLGFWLMMGFLAVLAVAIVLLFVGIRKRNRQGNDESEALAIIRRRYANGELTNDEFQQMKRDLR